MHGVWRRWIEHLHEEHTCAHHQWQYEIGIHYRKVLDPEDEWRLAQLHTFHERPIQGNEHWHLYQDGQTATHRVDLFFFVELHHGLGLFLLVIRELLADILHLGLYPSHISHRPIAGSGEFEKRGLDQYR